MHPLLHLLPAVLCAAFATVAGLELAQDLQFNTATRREISLSAAMILASTAAAAVSFAQAAAWTIGRIS